MNQSKRNRERIDRLLEECLGLDRFYFYERIRDMYLELGGKPE